MEFLERLPQGCVAEALVLLEFHLVLKTYLKTCFILDYLVLVLVRWLAPQGLGPHGNS